MSERHAPDLEDLAAFVDGRLSGERKARVEERLLRDEDYYEVFLETVHFREQQGREQDRDEEREPAPPVAISRWRSWRLAAPLAAAAVLAIAVGVLRPSADLAAGLDPQAIVARGETWTETGWSVTRSGGGGGSRYSREQLAFRLGARTVDLRVALRAGDPKAARGIVAQAEGWCGDTDLFSLTLLYRQLREQLEDGEPAALLGPAMEAEKLLAASFDGSEAKHFALGRWAEAGRLAALSEDAGALGRIVRRDPGARSIERIAAEIETLDEVVERADPGAQDFDEAAAAFRGLIARLAG